MLCSSVFGILLALFLAPAINSQRLCCYRMVIGNLKERSCVYWKPKGAAAKRASPRAIQPQSCPLMFWGRCLLVDFEGIWGRCWYAVCHILSDTVNTEARVAGVIARLLCAHDDARTHTQTLTHTNTHTHKVLALTHAHTPNTVTHTHT